MEAQRKLGYYPCPPEIAERIGRLLEWPAEGLATVFDPCCGCGVAVDAFSRYARERQTWGIELARERSEQATVRLDEVMNAAFEQCKVGRSAFSACWLNPPYDDELGGGRRTELAFLQDVTPTLRVGGVVVLLASARGMGNHELRAFLASHYEDVELFSFPETGASGYTATHVMTAIGRRRKEPIPDIGTIPSEPIVLPEDLRPLWKVPAGRAPKRWEAWGLTDEELCQRADRSPLWAEHAASGAVEVGKPLLPLKLGHLPLVLASGRLNGLIGDHLARATVSKQWHTVESKEVEARDGGTKVVDTQRQRVRLSIRVLAKRNGNAGIFEFA